MKVFLDTNVWLSAVVFPGLCAELLLELDARGHRWFTSDLDVRRWRAGRAGREA